jgi:hypothetical protein
LLDVLKRERRILRQTLGGGGGEKSCPREAMGRAWKAQLINQMKPGLRDQNMTDF